MDPEELQQIRRLLSLVDRYGLAELVVQEGDVTLTIRGPSGVAAVSSPAAPGGTLLEAGTLRDEAVEADGALEAELAPGEDGADGELHRLYSPMTGVFYLAPSPEARPYVEDGDEVEEGQTVGLIEAMKVFSEIPADVSGRIVRILAEAGKLVSQGEVLMLIEPEGPSI